VAEQSTHDDKIKGSIPAATESGRERKQLKIFFVELAPDLMKYVMIYVFPLVRKKEQ
jgi:hypothetical protein